MTAWQTADISSMQNCRHSSTTTADVLRHPISSGRRAAIRNTNSRNTTGRITIADIFATANSPRLTPLAATVGTVTLCNPRQAQANATTNINVAVKSEVAKAEWARMDGQSI